MQRLMPAAGLLAALLLLSAGCGGPISTPTPTLLPETSLEREALAAFYHAANGTGWINNTHWLTTAPVGEWYGVAIDGNGRVTELELANNELSGEIPPQLGSLASLTTLRLNRNQLSGEIPPQLGSLANLTTLQLNRNQLSGEIPPELGSLANLTNLRLQINQLSGGIPPELGSLANLTNLRLQINQLSGGIPPELGSLANLTHLRLQINQLSGGIPPELGSLANLTTLQLSRNQLSEGIPPQLGSLANLTTLQLSRNQLSGEIPPELGSLANLTHLQLDDNQLSGEIPPELGSLANLTHLQLDDNQLSGEIPPQLGSLTNLTHLQLDDNQLSGEIPPQLGSLANLTNLTDVRLEGNQFSEEIPPELRNPLPERVAPEVMASRSPARRPKIYLEPVFGNETFGRPIELGAYPVGPAGGAEHGVFVADQEGLILLLHPESGEAVEMLDISARVSGAVSVQGLLSVALDPRFEETGHLWLYYSVEGPPLRTRLSRFAANLDDFRLVDPGSELIVLEVNQPGPFHNGGSIRFGPDGMLYLGLGDGDTPKESQRLGTLQGSIIRIDVREASDTSRYAVPRDNPFVDVPGARPEIWAYGFRNPWRMALDPATGVLWAGDVGNSTIEEIDHIEAGGNYGWHRIEGTRCVNPSAWCDPSRFVSPVVTYSHKLGCAVVGGVVYRGKAIPALVGHYLFSDYCAGRLWALPPDGGEVVDLAVIHRPVSSFGADANGEVYILTFGGAVLRIDPP